jgi:hypothetical protein
MTVTVNSTRARKLTASALVGIANIGSGNGVSFAVPAGAFAEVGAHIVTAFNSATTTTISASDGTSTFISAEDAKAAALTNVTVDIPRKYFPSGGTITFSLAETGDAATLGSAVVWVEYEVVGRHDEYQGEI